MNVTTFLKRTLAVLLVLIMTMNDSIMLISHAVDGTAQNVQPFDTSDIPFTDEAADAFVQTMGEISRLLDAGQLTYDAERGMLVVTDPNADLSGLNLSGIAAYGPDGEVISIDDAVTLMESTLPVDDDIDLQPPKNENVLTDEEPTVPVEEDGSSGDDELPPDEDVSALEDPETPSDEDDVLSNEDGDDRFEDEVPSEEDDEGLPEDEITSEDDAESPTEDETLFEEDLTAEDALMDTELDPDVELMFLFDTCDHKQTRSANVTYYSNYKKDNRKKKGTIAAKNTIVEVVDTKREHVLWGDKWCKVKIPGVSKAYWVLHSNLKNHGCSASDPKSNTTYSQIKGNNDKHNKTVKTPAKVCACTCVMDKADTDTSKQNHTWNDSGICTKCNYNFQEKEKKVDKVCYMVISDSAVMHNAPYAVAKSTGTLSKGDTVTVTAKADNAFDNLWYKTKDGDWIWSDHVEKHTKHEYSKSTGRCACNKMFPYDIKAQTSAPYEKNVDHDPPIRQYPYSGAKKLDTLTKGQAVYINAYTYSDPNPSWIGGRTDKWYRLESGGWIKATDVVQHVNHKYAKATGGNCTISGCTYKAELIPWWLVTSKIPVSYETKKSGVVAYSEPYTTSKKKETYTYKGELLHLDQHVTNALKEKWYRTTKGYWVQASDVVSHTHHLLVGVCTTAGCSYVAKMNTSSMKSQVYELTGTWTLKEKPFDDARTIKTLPAKSCLTVNATCSVEGALWYRTKDGWFINSSAVKKHEHSYKSGYCAPCDTFQPWSTTAISPMVVVAKADKTVIREAPYSSAKSVGELKKGEQIVIVQQGKNAFKNVWYQLMDGSWIFSDNVKTTKGGTVKASSKLTIDNYHLTVVNYANEPIEGATVEWVGETYTTDETGTVKLAYVTDKTKIVIKKNKFDTVTLTDHQMSKSRKETITMAETGSYKATKVILNYLGADIDVLRTNKTLNQFHTQGFFDYAEMKFTCTVSDSVTPGKFQLYQGKNVIAESKNGVFEGLDVKDFDTHKTIYLKVFDKTGKEREKQALLIDIFNEGTDGQTPNLDLFQFSFTIPNKAPLVGGLKVDLNPPSIIDFSRDVGDESVKYSIEVDMDLLAKKVSKTKAPGKNSSKETYVSDFTAWKTYWNSMKQLKQSGWVNYFNSKQIEEALEGNKPDWDFALGGYIEKMHGESIYNGKLYFCVSVDISSETQHVGPFGIPVVFEVSFTGSATVGGKLTVIDAKITDFTIPLDFTASLELSGGVGIKHIGSISLFGQASFGLELQLYPWDGDEVNMFVRGSAGFKVKALGAEIGRWTFLESPILYIIQEGEFVLFEYEDLDAMLMDVDSYVPIDRSYLDDRSGWYDEGFELMDEAISVTTSDLDVDILQSSTYTDLKPQVVTATDGTIMMLFTDDNAERADIDRTMLVYSLYDVDRQQWSEPLPVDDDGTADYGFSVHSVDDEIYVAWQNAKTLHDEDADIIAVSKDLEVTVAKFDAVLGYFDHIQQITDNEQYENMPRISSVNGEVVVSWFTNSEDDIFQASGENTVYYAVKANEDYDTTEPYDEIDHSEFADDDLESEDLPEEDESDGSTEEETEDTEWIITELDPITETITSMAVGYMMDNGYVAYTTDEDGSTVTYEDQFIHLLDTQTGELMEYTDKACNIGFTQVHGQNAMTWYNQGLIFYALDPEYAPQQLFDEQVNLQNGYQLISDAKGNMALLFTQNLDNRAEAYLMLYDDETFEWGYPIAVTEQELYIRDFMGAYSDGMIVSIFNQTAVDHDNFEETNNLCSAIINERHDLFLSNVDVNTYALEPLAETPVWMTVTNAGTQRIDGFTVTLYDDNEDLVCQQIMDKPLKMGESVQVELIITMPEVIELSTYRLAVEEAGQEDVFPDNNEHSFTVGEPHLVLNATYEPSNAENIVVLTVTNLGYGLQGGSLVLLGENDEVEEVLVEQFEALEHAGEYSCAVAFNDYYFDNEPSKTFRFGIIPEDETTLSYETSLFVDKVVPAESADIVIDDSSLLDAADEDVSLQEVAGKFVSGTVRNDSDVDVENAVLCAVAYDERGLYLDTYTEVISLSSEETYSFIATFSTESDISTVRVMLLDQTTMEPLVAVSDITLAYDVTSN